MNKIHRDYKPLLEAALAQGWTETRTGKGHVRLLPPDGQLDREGNRARPVGMPSTPSDKRSLLNTRRDFRFNGIDC